MKSKSKLTFKRELYGYAFVLPFIIGLVFFFLVPIVQSLIISFGKINTENGFDIVVSGIQNYTRAFGEDATFLQLIIQSVTQMINVPLIIIVSFIIANLLKNQFPGRTLYRCLFFLPVILSTGILSTLGANDVVTTIITTGRGSGSGSNVLTASQQLISGLLLNANLSPKITEYIVYATTNILSILNLSGLQILIFLAALQSIPPSLYEASAIEGATGWENFWKITLPIISPQVLVVCIYTIIDCFVNVNNSIMKYIYGVNFTDLDFGYGSALAWVYFGLIIVILGVFYLLIKRFIFYYDR